MSLINTAITGIRSSQLGLSTTGNNIVNANTEGYTRQSVVNETAPSIKQGPGHIGTGVLTTDIIRNTDQALVDRVNNDVSSLSDVEAFLDNAKRVDNLLAGEDSNLSVTMDRFFDAVSESANDPSSMIGRELMLTESRAMIDDFREIEQRLRAQGQDVNARLDAIAGEVTTLARELAQMNESISFASSGGRGQPNDLLDKRDQLVRELAAYVDVDTVAREDGTMDITIGQGQPLVTGSRARELITQSARNDPGIQELAFVAGGRIEPVEQSLQGGEIGGLLRFRDDMLEPTINRVGRLMLGVVDQINQQHQLGMDLEGDPGRALFTDINDTGLTTGRISEFPGNSINPRSMRVNISDTNALTDSDYDLSITGPNGRYRLVRQSDGEVVSEGMLGNNRPVNIEADGFSVAVDSGTFQTGDRFEIRPTRFAAGSLETEIGRPEALALAAPVRTTTAEGNQGGATVSAGAVDSLATQAFTGDRELDPPVMIRFNSPTSYDVLDYSDPANPVPLQPPLMDQPFTPGGRTDVFPAIPGGTTVSTEGAAAQQLQTGQVNGYGPETVTVQTIEPDTGLLREQSLSISANESARDIADRLSVLDGVRATARSSLEQGSFSRGSEEMTLSLNGVDLTDPSVTLPDETSPQPVPDPPTADFLRDRINNDTTLQGQGIRASSDGGVLTVRSSRGDDLRVSLGGAGSSMQAGDPSQTVTGPAASGDPDETYVVGGRVDVQLGADMRLISNEANGIFGTEPAATDNYTGYQVTLGSGTGAAGQPAAGDRFYVEYNEGGKSDNRNAAALLALRDSATLSEDNLTFQKAYGQLVEDVGLQTSQARQSQQAGESMLRQSMDAWSSLSGVNLEEEAARLIELEQHYNASARLISLASELFDTLLNM
ncbi:MAG: flagellar hook-associated protein FlgK [Pseudomonadota bacterium]